MNTRTVTPFTGFAPGQPPLTKQQLDDHYKLMLEKHSIRVMARQGFDLVFEDGIRIRQHAWQDLANAEPHGPWLPRSI